MNRIARYIMVGASIVFMVMSSGCLLSPDPKSVWHDGVVTNSGDRTLYVAFDNPDPERPEYADRVRLTARTGSATYWLRERSKSNPYVIGVYDIDGNRVRSIKVSPDADTNDHGSWNWTVNAATGAVQFSVMTPSGPKVFGPDVHLN